MKKINCLILAVAVFCLIGINSHAADRKISYDQAMETQTTKNSIEKMLGESDVNHVKVLSLLLNYRELAEGTMFFDPLWFNYLFNDSSNKVCNESLSLVKKFIKFGLKNEAKDALKMYKSFADKVGKFNEEEYNRLLQTING